MKKRILSFILALMLCLTVTVSAEAENMDFIIDEIGIFTETELEELNDQAQELYDATGVAVFFVFTADLLENYDVDQLIRGLNDYFVMLEDEEGWRAFADGAALEQTDLEHLLRDAYDVEATYYGGIEAYLDTAAFYLEDAASVQPETDGEPFDFVTNLLIALGIGLLVGLIVALVLKGQLKTVRKQNQANAYIREDSMNLTESSDHYMYRNVTRTARQQNNKDS